MNVHVQVCSSVARVGLDPEFANNIGPNTLGHGREVFLRESMTKGANKTALQERHVCDVISDIIVSNLGGST